jgi:hypothetical protein
MSRPIIRIHNVSTDEVIDREMNNAEFAIYEAEQAERAIKQAEEQAEAEAKAVEKQALLDKLSITADEAKLLLG